MLILERFRGIPQTVRELWGKKNTPPPEFQLAIDTPNLSPYASWFYRQEKEIKGCADSLGALLRVKSVKNAGNINERLEALNIEAMGAVIFFEEDMNSVYDHVRKEHPAGPEHTAEAMRWIGATAAWKLSEKIRDPKKAKESVVRQTAAARSLSLSTGASYRADRQIVDEYYLEGLINQVVDPQGEEEKIKKALEGFVRQPKTVQA